MLELIEKMIYTINIARLNYGGGSLQAKNEVKKERTPRSNLSLKKVLEPLETIIYKITIANR